MNCIKCGKEIPEGELFCRQCSKPDTEVTPQSEAPAPTPKKNTVKQETIRLTPIVEKRKPPVVLIVALALACLVAAGAIAYIIKSSSDLTRQRNQLRVAEANVSTIQSRITSLENQLSGKNEEIIQLESDISEYKSKVAALESEIRGQTSQVSQSQYNSSTQEKENERLVKELEKAQTDLDAAEKKLAEVQQMYDDIEKQQEEAAKEIEEQMQEKDDKIEELEEKLATLESQSDMYLKKATFMDAHIVFIENDGTKYYHTFTCSKFKRDDYWVFNKQYAINQGYTACPECH